MRHCRFVLMLLMFILPLQSLWAAGASVCAHQADEAWHVGHHVHATDGHDHESPGTPGSHGDTGGPESGQDGPTGLATDFDAHCGACHGVGTAAFFALPSWHAGELPDRFGPTALKPASDNIPALLLRPPRTSLA